MGEKWDEISKIKAKPYTWIDLESGGGGEASLSPGGGDPLFWPSIPGPDVQLGTRVCTFMRGGIYKKVAYAAKHGSHMRKSLKMGVGGIYRLRGKSRSWFFLRQKC